MKDNISKKDLKHESILNLATEILSINPTATLQEIADYSKIGIATLHRHFSSRDELLDDLAINAVAIVRNALKELKLDPNDTRGSLMSLFDLMIPLGNKISFLGSTYSNINKEIIEEEQKIQEPILNMIRVWQHNGQLNNRLSAKWILEVIYNLLFVMWQEIRSGDIAKNDASLILLQTVLVGFEVNKGVSNA